MTSDIEILDRSGKALVAGSKSSIAAAKPLKRTSRKVLNQTLSLADKHVRKHVAAIHTSGELGLLERRMFNVLLLNAYHNLLTDRTHKISTKELCKMLGWESSNNLDALKDALRRLTSTSIEFNVLQKSGESWQVMSMLSFGEIKDGVASYRYDEDMAARLYNPDIFATINLEVQNSFEGGYSLTLYENCVRFKGVGFTGFWPLDTFRKLMGAEQAYYDDFKRLNQKVIAPSVLEINRVSDIVLTVETKKEGRKTSAIRFKISEAEQRKLPFANQADPIPYQVETDPLFKRLVTHGLPRSTALEFIKKDRDWVNSIIDYVEDKDGSGSVKKSTAGLIRTLVETNAVVCETAYSKTKKIQADIEQKAATIRAQKLAEEKLMSDYNRFRFKRYLKTMPEHILMSYARSFAEAAQLSMDDFNLEKRTFGSINAVKFTSYINADFKPVFDQDDFNLWKESREK